MPAPAEETIDEFIRSLVTPSSSRYKKIGERAVCVINLDNTVDLYTKWKELVPRVHPFFAVKCNDAPGLIQVLARVGCGFDCASSPELSAVASLDVEPERIIFANPIKTEAMLRHAANLQVKMMTFDSRNELLRIHKVYPEAELVLRLRVDDSGSDYQLGKKFGVELDEAIELLDLAASVRVNVIGVAFHVGSDCHKADSYQSAIQFSRVIFEEAKKFDFNMHFLDIGGGYPGVVNFNDPSDCFYGMVKSINAALDDSFPENEFPDLKIISEPGRYFAATSAAIITKIIGKKSYKLDKSTDEDKANGDDRRLGMMYFVNDGLFGDFLCKIWEPNYFSLVPGLSEDEMLERPSYQSIVWGPTCDSTDILAEKVSLPEMQIGECFIVPNYGSYSSTLRTIFNGMEGATFKYYISERLRNSLGLQLFE